MRSSTFPQRFKGKEGMIKNMMNSEASKNIAGEENSRNEKKFQSTKEVEKKSIKKDSYKEEMERLASLRKCKNFVI